MPKPGSEGHGKSGHLSDRLRRKAPRRYFTFTFSYSTSNCSVLVYERNKQYYYNALKIATIVVLFDFAKPVFVAIYVCTYSECILR